MAPCCYPEPCGIWEDGNNAGVAEQHAPPSQSVPFLPGTEHRHTAQSVSPVGQHDCASLTVSTVMHAGMPHVRRANAPLGRDAGFATNPNG